MDTASMSIQACPTDRKGRIIASDSVYLNGSDALQQALDIKRQDNDTLVFVSIEASGVDAVKTALKAVAFDLYPTKGGSYLLGHAKRTETQKAAVSLELK
jgi:hypothetical protein